MLIVEQVMPFVRHDDSLVVELAMKYLEQVRWPHRLNGDFVLQAVRDGHANLQRWLDDFVATADVLEYALHELEHPQRPRPSFDRPEDFLDRDAFWPMGVVARAPEPLFTPPVVERVRQLRFDVEWVEEHVRRRLEVLDWPTERVRERFLEACAEANDQGLARSEQRELDVLADALTSRGQSHAWAREQFERFLDEGDWTETWLTTMLVQARDRRAIEVAFERFLVTDFDENESLAEEYGDAIVEMSREEDVPRLADLLERSRGTSSHRLRLVESAMRLRLPPAEPLLVAVARETEDELERTFALGGLCDMCADGDEALALIADATDRVHFDITYADLESLAIPLGIMVGKPFPQADEWRKRLDHPEQRQKQREMLNRQRYPGLMKLTKLIEQLKSNQPDPRRNAALADVGLTPEVTVAPFVREAPKVGRNDPCPCGSGKKYKKCCLGKSGEVPTET